MSDIKVSEMPEATTLNDNDLLMVVQNGTNKKVGINKLGISSVDEKVNKIGTYSTEETDTGKIWVDGKSIYRKVLVVSNIATGENKSVDISSINFERIVSMTAIGTLTDGTVVALPHIYNDNFISMYEQNNSIHITPVGYSLTNVYITLEYVKTTN